MQSGEDTKAGTAERAPDANGWRTIDSAPKDGRAILVYAPRRGYSPYCMVDWFVYGEDGAADWRMGGGPLGPIALDIPPTHWQLPPNPPEPSK